MRIKVFAAGGSATAGTLTAGLASFACALGRSGLTHAKREGDGATPTGEFALRAVFYRPDRAARPVTALPVMALDPQMGWCDDPRSARYNQRVRLPFAASHERMWRDDHLYDLVVEIGYNDAPAMRGRGSAIFLHLAQDDPAGRTYAPTQGCVAIARPHMRQLLPRLGPGSVIAIG